MKTDTQRTDQTARSPVEVRCAVIGLGRIGFSLEDDERREKPCTHTGAILADGTCTLVGGCDTEAAARDAYKQRFNVPVYDSPDDLLRDTRPHIVCIATYPDSHCELVEAAVRHNVPVAVCEKPLAHRLRDGRRIASLHQSGRIRVLTNHERRYSGDYLAARTAIRWT